MFPPSFAASRPVTATGGCRSRREIATARFCGIVDPAAGEFLQRRISATLVLASLAAVLALSAGTLWGVAAAYVRGVVGTALRSAPLVFLSVPSFAYGIALGYVVAVWLRLLPPSGMESPVDGGGALDVLRHAVLPAVTLAILPASLTARITAGTLDELRYEDFVRTGGENYIHVSEITHLVEPTASPAGLPATPRNEDEVAATEVICTLAAAICVPLACLDQLNSCSPWQYDLLFDVIFAISIELSYVILHYHLLGPDTIHY